MRPTRLLVASLMAMAAVGAALLPPLQALVALAGRTGIQSFPMPASATAGAPLAARLDAAGHRRRIYFPQLESAGDPEQRARQLLAALGAELGLAASPPELERVSERHSPSGTHVRLRQTWHGIPLWGAEAVVSFDAVLAPRSVACDLEPAPALVADAEAVVPPALACSLGVGALGGVAGRQAAPRATLWYRMRDSARAPAPHLGAPPAWRLEYRVLAPCAAPPGDWEIWIDAASGTVLEVHDRSLFAVDGTANVFLPDPCLATGDPALQDAFDADNAVPQSAYTRVALRELETPQRGFHHLTGPWVALEDWEAPAGAPDSSATTSFERRRSEAGFEDAMVYYHLDALQRWFQQLGFHDANARRQVADAHGLQGQDNSKFVPSLHKLSFGEGGVDDAEDAEVLVHEYAHATQYDIVPTWGTGGHAGALGEGFGDYLANSYAWSLARARVEAWNGVFQWDGHNASWPGRRAIDTSMHYPEDAAGPVHHSGTLWCSALTEALYAIGDRAILDRLVLDSMYSLTGAALMEDWANAILASDVTLYHGAHVATLVEVFGRWGLVDAAGWRPIAIEHRPLDIAAASGAGLHLEARIVSSAAAIDPATVWARVRSLGGAWMAYPLAAVGDDRWTVTLPLPASADLDLEYCIEARDALGNAARTPAAPQATYRIAVGAIAERFEADSGWQVGGAGDAAYAGKWLRASPVGTRAQPGSDHTEDGTACFVTGNALPTASPSEADVDGGATTLTSPVYSLRGASGARLSYWRWFSNDQGTSPDEDPWTVAVSNDGGATWLTLESTRVSEARWRRMEFDLTPLVGAPDRLRVRFIARDDDGASLVEAAVDDVLLQVRTTTAANVTAVPPRLAFLPNTPNPCNPSTTLHFTLDRPAAARLALYDARGALVRDLIDAPLGSGEHGVVWDGCDAAGRRAASGVYLARLVAGGRQACRKVTVVR